jgi:3-oxoacyl-[acyl-carrier protein] reductase
MHLTNKVAFVTGGSGDIGGAICRALATADADVAVSYVGHAEGAAATVAAAQAAGRRAAAIQLDQRDPASIEAAVAAVIRQFGRLDILVNNAAWNIGIAFPDLDSLTADVWDRVQDTN